MNMENELSKNCPETENIYSDIIDFDLGTEVEKLKEENSQLQDHIKSLQQDIEKLVEAVKWLKTLQENLAKNISSLFLTAQTELLRKDRIIDDLRKQLEDLIFRRDGRKRKPESWRSPDHLSKRGRFDLPINVADGRKTISENNSHVHRGHIKKNFEKDNINHFNNGEGSNIVEEWNDRDDRHENDRYSTNSRAKSYGQNMDTRMKNGNVNEKREDHYIHSRKEDSRRGMRYSNHYRRTQDRKECQRNELCQFPRKRNDVMKNETHMITSDEELDVQNECSRIPNVEIMKEIDFERKKLKNSNEENRKPVRKKLKAVQQLEQRIWEKRASIENLPCSKIKSIQNKTGNYFAENMNNIMESVLVDIKDTKLLTVTKKEQTSPDRVSQNIFEQVRSEEIYNESDSRDNKEEKEKNKNISHNLKKSNLRFAKEESEAVVESPKQISDKEEKKEHKENQNKMNDKHVEPFSEKNNTKIKLYHTKDSKPIMSDCNKIERKEYQLNIVNDETSFTETIIEKSFSVKESLTDSQKKKSATNDEKVDNLSINNEVFSHKVKSHLEIHSQFEMSEFKVEEKNIRNNNRENIQQNISKDEKIENQSCQYVREKHLKKNESSENLSESFEGLELQKEIREINDKTIIKSTSDEKPKICENVGEKKHDFPDVISKKVETPLKCVLEENKETNSLFEQRRKLSPSTKAPQLKPQYKIPKKEKTSADTDSSIQKCDDFESQRNIVLASNEDHKSSYEGRHRGANRTNERYQKSRPKSVPRSFLRQKSEEREHRARSRSRGRYMRSDNLEERREIYRHGDRKHPEQRFRMDDRMNIYSRRKSFSGESEYRNSSRNYNEKSHSSSKDHGTNIRDPRTERSKSRSRIDGVTDEIKIIERNVERTRVSSLAENDDNSEINNIHEHVKNETNKCKKSHQTIKYDITQDLQKDTCTKNRVIETIENASIKDRTETKCSTKKSKEGTINDCKHEKDLQENTANKASNLVADEKSDEISTNLSKENMSKTNEKKISDVKVSCDDVATKKHKHMSSNKEKHKILAKDSIRISECEEKETKSIQGKYKDSALSEKENELLIRKSCSEKNKDNKSEELFKNSSETEDNLPQIEHSDERIKTNRKKIKQATEMKPVEEDALIIGTNSEKNPENLTGKNIIETAVSQKTTVDKKVNVSSSGSVQKTNFERLHESNLMKKPENKCSLNKQERVVDSESNKHLETESSDRKADKLSKDSSSHKRKRKNRELQNTNNKKYPSDIISSETCAENIETETRMEEKPLINTKEIRNMPDILTEDSNPQPVQKIISLKETSLKTEKPSKANVRSKRTAVQNESVKHQKSKTSQEKLVSVEVSKEIAKNKDEARDSQPSKLYLLEAPSEVKDSSFSSNDSPNVECSHKCVAKSDEPNVDISEGNSDQVLLRKRITPIRVDDSPICTFENILKKNSMPSFAKDLSAPNASPLTLTHEGDIPLLHLEENHFHSLNDDGTQKSMDRNIINLLDSMNMSNLDCDITKFQVSSDKHDKHQSVNESAVNQENGEVSALSTKTPDVVMAKSEEPTVSITPTTQNEVGENKSICSNNVQNSGNCNTVQNTGTNTRIPLSNLSRIGRRRRVRLVVID